VQKSYLDQEIPVSHHSSPHRRVDFLDCCVVPCVSST
jgi:hypothetical protein